MKLMFSIMMMTWETTSRTLRLALIDARSDGWAAEDNIEIPPDAEATPIKEDPADGQDDGYFVALVLHVDLLTVHGLLHWRVAKIIVHTTMSSIVSRFGFQEKSFFSQLIRTGRLPGIISAGKLLSKLPTFTHLKAGVIPLITSISEMVIE